MDLLNAINQFYYEMSLSELRLMNDDTAFPNLSYNSYLYLNVISYKENCTVSMLADILQVTKSAATIKVNDLVKQGYLKKIQSEKDRRVFYLKICPEVDGYFNLFDTMTNRIIKGIEEKYTEKEIALFCDILQLVGKYQEGGRSNE